MTADDILKNVNLRYSTDSKPGFTRKVQRDTFYYFDLDGKRITNEKTIERINKLVIPPAYDGVWICQYENGHLQATGYDARKRKQYRYHPLWTRLSQQEKFSHMVEFAHILPDIRKRVRLDLARVGMPQDKVIAAVVWLLENTLIRIGNEEYEKDNKSYGLTTLKNKHVAFEGAGKIKLTFKGKSGVPHKVSFKNKKVAGIIRRCRELPGQDLFEYLDDDKNPHTISSQDVNEYLQKISGTEVTAKDFRTWGGTLLAAAALDSLGVSADEIESKKNVVEAIKKVATHLRNKPSTCKKYYIHPFVIEAYIQGFVLSNLRSGAKKQDVEGLDSQENNVLHLLTSMLRSTKNRKTLFT